MPTFHSWQPALFAISFGVLAACGDASSDLNDQEPRIDPLMLDFAARPSYLPDHFIALTFDDVPDWNHTARVLDVLNEKNVTATFFINTSNWSNVPTEAPMQELIRRMAREGHELGNHTARHPHLGALSAADIEHEIATVERLTAQILGPAAPPLNLVRAPYGEPYRDHVPGFPTPEFEKVASVVARHGVHIGWAIDAFDYTCPDAACVTNNVMQRVDAGAYGIVLMHGVYAATVDALPSLIDTLRDRGFVLGTVEDAVEARYGASSRELVGR
ncbi:polysaccharide deacetylase family protein [Oligoflexus tunisiensis]|uniref:polysaccharide deacetylase family protein n=1 Tax=Oligoflexus tunisiensis TaxID=708132 RepID=UPI00114CBCF2|nr:polysaccharide deacetylase family protein [Oligoflexus tunisiensis]